MTTVANDKITLVADHKGHTGPRVRGDEYFVDALIDVATHANGGVTVNASSLGLSTITAVFITGRDESAANVIVDAVNVEVSSAGDYESGSSFKLHGTIMSSGLTTGTGAVNIVRVRVYGLL